jgi:hypothetical protein
VVQLGLKVSLFLLENKSHGIPTPGYQKQGLRFVLRVIHVLPAALPLMMGLMETSTASMVEMLEVGGMRMAHLVRALPATLASVVQTVLSVQQAIVDHLQMTALLNLVKPHQPPLTMGLTVTSTASMEGILGALQDLAPALATLGLMVLTVKIIKKVP